MVLGQTMVAGSVVQGEKLRFWVKRCPVRVWSEERNYGLGSSAGGGKYGPGSQTAGLGQALVAGSVVQGAKLRPWVKPVPAKVWSREPNCGPGHPLPRQSVVQGAKPCPRVKPDPAKVWSREQNRAPGSLPSPPECGLGSKTAAPGQAPPEHGPRT